ncbi:AlpA family transcriptional regulator [Cyanobium sp. CH-040]|uniref:AlpA family transcriptional regulator n=1 Tax=Cyanobium sp. CH-040 TaxID=2823708 RepID=UPI0020CF566E|nr:AlpA family transcriptional regulator [Cyanobium sp. CH-040]MCP9926392.1 AlpA family transcriptional regulator [Cyanobium sp. CH-040]
MAKFIRLKQVIEKTTLSKSEIYRLVSTNEFPSQVSLGGRSVAWVYDEVDNWCNQKINSRN